MSREGQWRARGHQAHSGQVPRSSQHPRPGWLWKRLKGPNWGPVGGHLGGGSRDNRRVAMHKSKTSAELEGPWQLARTREGCPKSRRTPFRLRGSPASSGVRKKLRSQPEGQAGGNWSPTPKRETEAWEVGGCGEGAPQFSSAGQPHCPCGCCPHGGDEGGETGMSFLWTPRAGMQGRRWRGLLAAAINDSSPWSLTPDCCSH